MNLDILKKSSVIKLDKRDNDKRGSIISICDSTTNNVSIITSNKNTLRSNHYHKKDWHLIYVLSGCFYYFYKKIKSKNVKKIIVNKDQCVFTPALEIHATYFPIKTKLIVISKNKRDQINYEKDTVRVNFINKENLNKYINA